MTSNGSDDEDSDTSCDYDTAISRTGYGKFHYLLMLVCGWANASDAVEILCISFLLPSAECDLELTPARKGWLSAILFVGMMIGGYVWGSLGDTLGRRTVLINAMVVNTVAGLLSSLSQDFYLFMLLRFLSGVGVGGSIPVVWTYYAGEPLLSRGPQLLTLSLRVPAERQTRSSSQYPRQLLDDRESDGGGLCVAHHSKQDRMGRPRGLPVQQLEVGKIESFEED